MKPQTKKTQCKSTVNPLVCGWAIGVYSAKGGVVRQDGAFGVVQCELEQNHAGEHEIKKPITRKVAITLDYCYWSD